METAIQEEMMCPACDGSARRLCTKDRFSVARCVICQTLFIENPPHDTSALYDKSYFFGDKSAGGYGSYDDEKEAMRATFERCLDLISNYQGSGALYDVGAATGYFLALARSRGFRVSGIDISAVAAHEAQKKGIDVATGAFESTPHNPASFDVVTLFDVLEHVPQPSALIKKVVDMLAHGGILMGCTPDSMSATARIMGKHWHLLLPPEHLVLLNDRSLRLLLSKHGFEILWTGRIIKRFSLPYILQTASRWLRIPLLNRAGSALRSTRLGRIAIPLDLRDNVFFLARKKTLVA